MSWIKKRTVIESIEIMVKLAKICAKLGGPLSNQLFRLADEGRYQDLIDFNIDYTWAFTRDDFIYSRQIKALFEKQDFIDLGIDKEAVAFEKFIASEEKCRQTNLRFESSLSPNRDVAAVLHGSSEKIRKILGKVPSYDSLDFSFGPGASTSTDSLIANVRSKLSSSLECSMNLIPALGAFLAELPMLCDIHKANEDETSVGLDICIVPGKLAFVPKNSKTHRTIVVEPLLNGLGQKGIGSYMKKRLSIAGVDLSDQTRNRDLALAGSQHGQTVTVDLVSASDTIARQFVWDQLPYDWACLLDMFRSPVVTYKGVFYELEKFSSMGNAFTFELESLLFYSLTLSTCEYLKIDTRDVSAYGDDLICPVAAYDLLKEVLDWCGFEINFKKSFSVGPFRESCGADFLNGIDIRPFYLKTLVNDRILYSMHNFFYRNCEFVLARAVFELTHEPERLRGPDGYGDGHLIGDHSLRTSRANKRKGFCGGVFDSYTLGPKHYFRLFPGDYVYPFYSIYVAPEANVLSHLFGSDGHDEDDMFIVRGTRGYKKLSIYTLASGIFTNQVKDGLTKRRISSFSRKYESPPTLS